MLAYALCRFSAPACTGTDVGTGSLLSLALNSCDPPKYTRIICLMMFSGFSAVTFMLHVNVLYPA